MLSFMSANFCGFPNIHWHKYFLLPLLFNLEIMPSSITEDAKTLNMLEFIPALPQELNTALSERQAPLKELQQAALKNSNLNSEEFKEIILNRQSETEDKSLSELKKIASAKHFTTKRNKAGVANKCCNFGCTRKELAQYCWDKANCVLHLMIICILPGIHIHRCLPHPHWLLEYE